MWLESVQEIWLSEKIYLYPFIQWPLQKNRLNMTKKSIETTILAESTYTNNFLEVSSWNVTCLNNNIPAYSNKAKKTIKIQTIIHVEIEVRESVFGDLEVTLMNRLIRTKIRVINRAILPGTTSGGMRKLI